MDVSRRIVASSLIALAAAPARAVELAPPDRRAWDFSFTSIDEGVLNFADFRGRVLLVVNTASFCGYTYQYEALEKLHAELTPRGLTVVGFPSQDFNQEKGSNAEVKAFCDLTYDVQFPMAGLSHVRGSAANPFYQWVRARQNWEPDWNFNKVLIGRSGQIVTHYGSSEEPQSPMLAGAVLRELNTVA